MTRPVPTTAVSSSSLASAATPKHSSMASKFLNAANSVRKIAQPALSRLQHVTGAPGPQAADKETIKVSPCTLLSSRSHESGMLIDRLPTYSLAPGISSDPTHTSRQCSRYD